MQLHGCRKGANRTLHISKPSGKAALSDVHTISLNSESHGALLQHFNMFPVTKDELSAALAGEEVSASSAASAAGASGPQKPSGAAADVALCLNVMVLLFTAAALQHSTPVFNGLLQSAEQARHHHRRPAGTSQHMATRSGCAHTCVSNDMNHATYSAWCSCKMMHETVPARERMPVVVMRSVTWLISLFSHVEPLRAQGHIPRQTLAPHAQFPS